MLEVVVVDTDGALVEVVGCVLDPAPLVDPAEVAWEDAAGQVPLFPEAGETELPAACDVEEGCDAAEVLEVVEIAAALGDNDSPPDQSPQLWLWHFSFQSCHS